MKIFSTAIAAIVGITAFHAEASQLRTGVKTNDQIESGDVRVTIHGLVSLVSDADMVIISKTIVDAYNEVNKLSGSSIASFNVDASFSGKFDSQSIIPSSLGWRRPRNKWICRYCPDDDSVMVAEEYEESSTEIQIITASIESNLGWRRPRNKWICRYCPDDDSVTVAGIDTHKMFEEKFCADIQSSGSPNLSGASGCSISYLETVVDGKEIFDEACNRNKILDAQVVVNGILNDFTEQELDVIATSIKSAYNDAFMFTERMGLGYLKGTFAKLVKSQGIVYMEIAPLCLVNNDSSAISLVDTTKNDVQKAFEGTFCSKLQASGIANLANARDCTFRFVNDKTKSENSKVDYE